MTIQYSCISRGATVLVSHQVGAEKFEEVAHSMLKNIPTRINSKTTYTSESYSVHTVVANGIIYLCAADSAFGHRQPYGYLMEIKKRFETGALLSRAQFAMEGELNRDFAPVMSSQMEVFSQPGGSSDNISALQNQVNEVKNIMTQNIEKVLERGERLEDLIEHTSELEAQSNTFRKASRSLHKKMWWKNTKMTIILVLVGLAILMVVILVILFSTHVLPVSSGGEVTTKTTTTTAANPGL